MPPTDRVKRPPPEDSGPDRSGWSNSTRTGTNVGHPPPADGASYGDAVGGSSGPPPSGTDTQYSDAVADSVKLAYAVIRDNIAQGRAAASKFRDGEYNVRDVPHDVNVLSLRLLSLTRELSRTSFDILEGILSNPRTPGATAGRPPPPHHDPRQFHPGAGPFNPDWNYTGATARQGPAQPDTRMIPISCVFTGARHAKVRSATLSRPQSPTHLLLPVLASLKAGAAPIMGATVTPSSDPYGVMVSLEIPAGQPPGIYSGAILDDQGYAAGALTIEVFAEAP